MTPRLPRVMRTLAVLTAGLFVLTSALTAQPPAKPAAPGSAEPAPSQDDLKAKQEDNKEKFRAFKEALFRLATRLEKSDRPEAKDQAKVLRQALDEIEKKGVDGQFANLVAGIAKSTNAIEIGKLDTDEKQLVETLKLIMAMIESEGDSAKLKAERERLEQLVKELKALTDAQKSNQARTESMKGDIKKLKDEQDRLKENAKDIAERMGAKKDDGKAGPGGNKQDDRAAPKGEPKGGEKAGEGKADTGEAKGAGKEGEGKEGKEGAGEAKGEGKEGKEGKDGAGQGKDSGKGDGKEGKEGAAEAKGGDGKEGSGKEGKEGDGQGKPSDGKGDGKEGMGKPGDGNKPGDGGAKKPGDGQGKPADGGKPGDGKGQGEPKGGGDKPAQGGGDKPGQGGEGKGQGKGQGEGKGEGKGSEGKGQGGEGKGSGKEGGGKPPMGGGQGQGGSKGGGQPPQGGGQQPPPGGGGQPPKNDTPGRKEVQEAIPHQGDASKKIEDDKRADAGKSQDKAIEELQKAIQELEKRLKQLREEEIKKLLANVEARCQRMLAMQIEVYENTKKIDGDRLKNGGEMDTAQRQRSGQQSDKENEIVAEAERCLKLLESEGSAVAFAKVLEEVKQDMIAVSRRLNSAVVDKDTQAIEENIIAMLKEMVEALKKQQQSMNQPPKPPGEGGQPPKPPNQKLIDLIAELKLIRSLQSQVNMRTKMYGDKEKAEQSKDPNVQLELRQLSARQQKLQEMIEKIAGGENEK